MPMHEDERDERMELERARGGLHDPLTPANAAGPASAYPPHVAQTLSHLANLIDSSIELRGTGIAVRDFAAAFLGVPTTEIVSTNADLGTLEFQLTALAFADDLEVHAPSAVIGQDAEEPPHWHVLDLGELRLPVRTSSPPGSGRGGLRPARSSSR